MASPTLPDDAWSDLIDERSAFQRLSERLKDRLGRAPAPDEVRLAAREYAAIARVLIRISNRLVPMDTSSPCETGRAS